MDGNINLGDTVEVGLQSVSAKLVIERKGRSFDLLVFTVLIATEFLAFRRDVHPEATLTTYRAGSFDLKADAVCRFGGRREVDVSPRDIGGAAVGQWQQIHDLLRGLWCRHG